MPNFLEDYLFYNSGNECPQRYHLWGALSVLANAIGPKVFFKLGGDDGYKQLVFYCNMYVGLVGTMGSRKTVAREVATEFLTEHLPEITISSSVDSVRGITKKLSKEKHLRSFVNEKGELQKYTPYFQSIDEIINYVSVDPARMVNFWVQIFGCKDYVHEIAGVEVDNQVDSIKSPYINILACGTTDYVIDLMRDARAAGGLARRFIMVVHEGDAERKPDPKIPLGGIAAFARCAAHIKTLVNIKGQFTWATPDDEAKYQKWYVQVKVPLDPLMAGFYSSKHVYGFKIAMLLAAGNYEPMQRLVITFDMFEAAIQLIESLEPGMLKIFQATGRNPLSAPMLRMMDLIRKSVYKVNDVMIPGIILKSDLMRLTENDFEPIEQFQVLRHLRESKQLLEIPMNGMPYYVTTEALEKIKK